MSTISDEDLLEMDGIVRDEKGRIRFRIFGVDKGGFSSFEDD